MINFDKWNKEIVELKGHLAVVNDIPCCCDSIECNDCDLSSSDDCVLAVWDWLWEEYKEVEDDKL